MLAACSSNDGYSGYIGYWQHDGISDRNMDAKIAKIYKDGDTYLINADVNSDFDILRNRKRVPYTLSANDGNLTWDTGMGSVELGVSKDGDTLYASNSTFTKIDDAKANKIAEKLKTCAELTEQHSAIYKKLKVASPQYQAKNKEITAEFADKFSPYEDVCRLPNFVKTELSMRETGG